MNKNQFLILCCLVFSIPMFSQNISYGTVLGVEFYQSNNNNGENQLVTKDNKLTSSLNLGAFFEYGFTENIGIKTELTFNKKKITYNLIDEDIKLNFFEFSPSFKYDFGDTYNEGFYMFIGPRFSFLTEAETESNNDVKDSFEKTNIGLQLGLGSRVSKFIDIQGKLDYGISPYFELSNGDKSSFFGIYFSLNVDLEKFINKH